MKPGQPKFLGTISALLFLAVCQVHAAWASEGGAPNPAEEPIGTLFHWLNFFLVFGGLAYLIAKNGPAVFRRRAEDVAAAISEAAATRADAEKQLRGAEEKLARLSQEVAELRAAAQRESAAEADRLRGVTRSDAEKIARAAQAEIAAAERAARTELKAIAARLAVERAETLLEKQMTADTQARLFRSFLNNLSRSTN